MDLNEYLSRVFAAAEKAGFEACECCYSTGEELEISVFGGEIDDYSLASSLGLSFRGLFGGKMGYASTRVLDDAAIDWLIESAKSSAELVDNDDKEFLFAGSDKYETVKTFNPELENVTPREKIDMALQLEKQMLAADERIKRVQGCAVMSSRGQTRMVNTLGLDVSEESNSIGAYIAPIAESDGSTTNGMALRFGQDKGVIDIDAMVSEAAAEATDMLGASPCKSGTYKVLLRRDVMSDLLRTFDGMFSADSAQHGLSLLKDREGDKIAADIVTLIDDPLREGGLASGAFDAEGVATYTKSVIENGVLKTLLHNLKTAYKQGVKSTGNASKGSLGGSIGVSPSNFYIKPGQTSFNDLVAHVGSGVLVTDIMGMHSGANGVSGDFSLGARGFLIEDGKIARPVKGITIAGNFLRVMQDIAEVGSDLWFGMPGGSCCGAPSVVVSQLSVAGD